MIKLEGEAKLLKRIEKVRTEKALYRLACREAAKIVQQQVKADLPKLTGATARNVKVKSAGGKVLGAKVVVGTPGTDTYRGWFLESGTTDRYSKKGAYRGKMKAGNFVEHATRSVEDKAIDKAQSIISEKIWNT